MSVVADADIQSVPLELSCDQKAEVSYMKKKNILILLCASILGISTAAYGAVKEEQTKIEITSDSLTPFVCEKEDYSVKLQRTYYNQGFYEVEFMVENRTNDNLIFGLVNSDIDGFQVTVGTSGNSINAGKKGVIRFSIHENTFVPYGIESFDIWSADLSLFPFDNAEISYPLRFYKEVFLKDSDNNAIETTLPSKLLNQIDALNDEIASLKSENERLKSLLKESKEHDAASDSSDTVSINFNSSVPNDVTGKWRLATTETNRKVTDYATNYYKMYFGAKDEIHGIINSYDNTTSCLSIIGGELSVVVHKYIDGEENDASLLFGGDVLEQYYINLETGKIEKV